ncbi:hypothetical protein R3W88_027060 [Solanum pinnatisectum]|uniref:SPARK domain-containing protein n=1 Tax=Solanum pinnatisectum TaxID=50273 RepID=A0AAV9LEY8_9SOLN|nr:hypothetical protein R3W88_027060 [Solanum pinnatisectum]
MKYISIDQEIIHEWDSFPTTRCCQNALNFFTQALAKQAIQQGNLFLHKDQWGRCASGSFEHQPSVSINKCGLNSLYQQSSQCSILSLTAIVQDHSFKDVRDNCSSFTYSNSTMLARTARVRSSL